MTAVSKDAFSLAEQFLDACATAQPAPLELVDLLCAQAMHDSDQAGREAMAALYRCIVEGLCDDFSERATSHCVQVLLRMIELIRRAEAGKDFDRWLLNLGYADNDALLAHYQKIHALGRRKPLGNAGSLISKVVVLSRVTIGADVSITGIIVQRLARQLPDVEIVLVGPRHLESVFFASPRVRCRGFSYPRFGSLVEKIISCQQVAAILEEEVASAAPGETVLFDPDTRLSQLGLLPLLPASQTYYFPSREGTPATEESSLVALTNSWCDTVIGSGEFVWPAVFFDPAVISAARQFVEAQRQGGAWVVVINLGVGHNDNKRLADPFEQMLLLRLLSWRKTVVILDSGASPLGWQRADRLLAAVRREGYQTSFVAEGDMATTFRQFDHGVIGFRGGVAAIGSVISTADCFFGYDSCCQHLANAGRTPSTIAFAGAPHARFIHRWYPHNSADSVRVITVGKDEQRGGEAAILALVEKIACSMRQQSRPD